MDTLTKLIAAKEAVEDAIMSIDGVTGIDIGVRDENDPNPDDLAVRIFVRNADQPHQA